MYNGANKEDVAKINKLAKEFLSKDDFEFIDINYKELKKNSEYKGIKKSQVIIPTLLDKIEQIIETVKDEEAIAELEKEWPSYKKELENELKEAGISCPGDRAKILIRIQEKAGNFRFNVPKSVYYTCKNLNKIDNDVNINNLRNWLKKLRIDNYLTNFIENGYHSIELLLLQMESQCPLTTEILKEEIRVDKIGHRSRIINKLKRKKKKK